MAMKSRSASAIVMFDVIYEDGTRSSNRTVPASALSGLDGDEPARGIVEAQDREIGRLWRHYEGGGLANLSHCCPRPFS